MISEKELIGLVQEQSDGFIGDDAAVLPSLTGERYLISKDLLIEDVHFRIHYFTPQDLAHKALNVNLSDLAAMGAKPLYVLCGIAIPKGLQEYARHFLQSLTLACKEAGIILIGGDTTSSQEHLFISITVLGSAHAETIKYRNSAKVGDVLCLAGNLGFAHLGFTALENNNSTPYTPYFLRPDARIKEGLWLAKQKCITSMMDSSDGLFIDVNRLCDASGKGAVIDLDKVQNCLEPEVSLQIALEGGEDYGLLFTVNPHSLEELTRQFAEIFNYPLKIIGFITEDQSVSLQKDGQHIDLNITPFTHFGEKL
ncbi:thiamine-phosphate kinase [Legionella shakespearei]|uniref:Thiamine-monophosphate kinase n=1 Tax=Legionella shakespearei DSM 23087 TaxID=1122169 RepID=A0A0W0Z618_9GAMM|nr:thiamine-phosphate kinase [Legionella shakespearei]KTD64600.1 Thiamine-monophosphate kinase [Legionella shakespearei DSM 23087]